ncbi:MAG TPA: phosphatase PAP2 family protein, partial [Kineosporiaceae bacterium]|nr:phosphatase PAP2 family protein [Kineosporiaceae bacterium]
PAQPVAEDFRWEEAGGVPQLEPSWQLSAWTAAALVAVAVGCLRLRGAVAARVGSFARDFAVVMSLLGVWQWVGGYVHTRVAGAMERAETIYRLQRALRLPDEVAVQQLVLPYPWLVRAANTYYGYAHLNGMAVFLVWLWWRHRADYARARTVIVLSTLTCLLVQIVPVAPPRLLAGHGFVDTALRYGQSVYGDFGTGLANQLSAMPSVHVGWAVVVAVFLWRCGGRGWRWLGVGHAALTVVVVVVTANHWWLDGLVAAVIVAVSLPLGLGLDRLAARLPRLAGWAGPSPHPVPAPARPADVGVVPLPRLGAAAEQDGLPRVLHLPDPAAAPDGLDGP